MKTRRQLSHLCIAAFLSLAAGAQAIKTNQVELGREGVYDGVAVIGRDSAGNITFKDQAHPAPLTLGDLLDGAGGGSLYLRQDGTRTLSADWNAGTHKITAGSFTALEMTAAGVVKNTAAGLLSGGNAVNLASDVTGTLPKASVQDSGNWDAAYGWGNHASAGYQAGDATLAALAAGTITENFTVSDDKWIGLGAAAGRIEFDDQTVDEVNILNAYLGVGTSTPTYGITVASASGSGSSIKLINTGVSGRTWTQECWTDGNFYFANPGGAGNVLECFTAGGAKFFSALGVGVVPESSEGVLKLPEATGAANGLRLGTDATGGQIYDDGNGLVFQGKGGWMRFESTLGVNVRFGNASAGFHVLDDGGSDILGLDNNGTMFLEGNFSCSDFSHNGSLVSFFSAPPAAKSPVADLGALAADGTYNTVETDMLNNHQAKINAILDALQSYGLL